MDAQTRTRAFCLKNIGARFFEAGDRTGGRSEKRGKLMEETSQVNKLLPADRQAEAPCEDSFPILGVWLAYEEPSHLL